ncbi:MAG TPA: 3'-5' exonuclease, partial [Pirellulaceae bacterium]|nr:3'-5' exonuclease [Pirellulaceae bacterium]
DWLEQMTEGTLILSPRGERLVRDMDFYSSFVSAQELTVRHDGREIGTLASRFQPLPGNHFLLAGRRWEALEVDLQAGEIRVRPAVGRKSPKFSGGGGEIHPQIRAEMKRALESRDSFSYLNTAGRRFLELARASYRELVSPDSPFIDLGPQGCLWLTWTGTRIQRTLMALAQLAELECRDHRLALQFRDEPASIVQSLVDISSRLEDDNALTQGFTIAPWRKFDACLSEALLLKPFVSEFLDLPGARRALEHARQALSRIPSNGAPPPQIVSKVIVAPSKETVSEFAPASRMGVRPNEGDTPAPTEANATMTIVPSTAGNEVTAAESRRVRVGRASRIATKVSASQLAECEFVALDLETTGLDQRSRIVEIGAIRFRLREEPVVEFHSLIDPEVPIPASATRVHGISNEMVAGRPTIAEALPRFADYLSERPVIIAAHNARFDLSFLQAAAREIQIAFPIAPYIDTLELARQALPQLPNHRLVTVVAYLGSRTVAAHRSLADANHVRFVLERLLLDLKVDPFVVR